MLDQSAGIPKRAHRGAMRSEIWEMVRAWGLEPQRLAAREPKGDVTTVICFCLQKIDDYLDPKIT